MFIILCIYCCFYDNNFCMKKGVIKKRMGTIVPKMVDFERLFFVNDFKVLPFCKGVENAMLSEQDIINLFLGFVRLIKRSATLEVEQKYRRKIKDLIKSQSKINSKK